MARYIDLKKAIEAIEDLPNCPNGYSDTYDKECIIGTLEEVPTADVRENVHAHWVIEREQLPNGEIAVGQFCSNCDYPQYLTTKFCPNCGAVMDERSDNEETN